MRQIRSADPWSTFLTTQGRGAGVTAPRSVPPPAEPARTGQGHGDDVGAADARGRVLERLRAARGPLTLEQIHHATRLGLLEVADAVERLRDQGLVAVEHEIDEVVRLTGDPAPGTDGPAAGTGGPGPGAGGARGAGSAGGPAA
ncbi:MULTISPECIES: hypothetical protein [Actinomadura]|uniref:FtsK gamma domain-containing protein n=1 Tax=Actinomadura yumaensis TaxID=111807 RepID=A0ABW2CK49_9ACTN|nr:hypothetical protein [Actinomadura sp. J1-007]MWK32964.1 hypothetical protein [Actinomadura sp. J1-007]